MQLFLQRLFDALSNGFIYAALAVAISLGYRSSGHLNFALGEGAMFSTYAALILLSEPSPRLKFSQWAADHLGTPWPIVPAFLGAIVVGFVISLAIYGVFLGRGRQRTVTAVVGITIGVGLLLHGLVHQTFGDGFRAFPTPFPQGLDTFVMVRGARLWYANIGIAVTLATVLVALALAAKLTKIGLAFRAVTASRSSSELVGISVGRTLMLGWGVAGALGSLAGVLVANSTLLEPSMMARLLLYSIAAATIGGLDNPLGAAVGGIVLAMVQTMAGGYVPAIGGDVSELVAIAFLMLVLFVRPHGLLGRPQHDALPASGVRWFHRARPGRAGSPSVARAARAPARPPTRVVDLAKTVVDPRTVEPRRRSAHRVLHAVCALGLLAPLFLSAIPLRDVTRAVAMTLAVLGVNLMAGFVGRVALGHGAFVGAGAYTCVILSADHHWPLLATVPAAAVVGLVIGLVVGVPALRIRGLQFALVTLAVGAAFGPVVKRLGTLTNGPNGKLSTAAWDAPPWFGETRDATGRWIYLTVLVVTVVVFVLVRNLTTGRVGRSLVALRDGELAATTSGVPVKRYSVAMFGCSAAVASIGGALMMLQTPYATLSAYESSLSLYLYAAAVVGGLATIRGAVVGGIFLAGVPYVTTRFGIRLDDAVVFGLALVASVTLVPGGIGSVLTRPRESRLPRRARPAAQ